MGYELMNEVNKIKAEVEAGIIGFVSNMKIRETEGLLYLYLTCGDVVIKELNFYTKG